MACAAIPSPVPLSERELAGSTLFHQYGCYLPAPSIAGPLHQLRLQRQCQWSIPLHAIANAIVTIQEHHASYLPVAIWGFGVVGDLQLQL